MLATQRTGISHSSLRSVRFIDILRTKRTVVSLRCFAAEEARHRDSRRRMSRLLSDSRQVLHHPGAVANRVCGNTQLVQNRQEQIRHRRILREAEVTAALD